MADAIVSAVAEHVVALIEEQARYHINLVRGAEKEIRSLATELEMLRHALNDAENRRFKDKMVNTWVSRLERVSYAMEDVLDEWNYALLKLQMDGGDDVVGPDPTKKVWSFIPSSPCLCFKKVVVRHDIAEKILNVKAQIDEVLKMKDRYNFAMSQPTSNPSPNSWRDPSTSFTDLEKVCGRDSDRDILVTKLMPDGGRSGEKLGIQVVSIVGVGGLGKTTLAQLVYNDSRVEKYFDLRIWICVSAFDMAAIARGIIESIKKGSSPNTTQLDVLLKIVQESISGKKFLLVLDDVWTEDSNKWEPLENTLRHGGVGSRILVTTRNERVARIMGTMDDDIHRPGELSHEDCWLMMCHMGNFGRRSISGDLEKVGREIARKCKGLPLAAKTLGSLLCFKNTLEEWENVLNSEVWELKNAEVDIFPHLLLSYNELSPTLKRCFSYCAVFPKDYRIDVEMLIRLWMAQGYLGSEGYMEGRGREYFDILAMHSLFQEFDKDDLDGKIIGCKMHDIVHDFARFLRKSGRVEAAEVNQTSCQACSDGSSLVSTQVNEFCSLFWDEESSPPNLHHCLTRLRILSLISLPEGMGSLIHLRWLELQDNKLTQNDLKIIFQLYNLQTLILRKFELEEIRSEIGNLIHLRHLDLSFNQSLKEVPSEIGNLVQLRHLELKKNDSLKELPREIGKLIQLRHLHLSWNKSLKEVPSEIGNLVHLRHLDLSFNWSFKELPESICELRELQTLNVTGCKSLGGLLPAGLNQLTNLSTLGELYGGSGWNKLGLLNKLNKLGGYLGLHIKLGDADTEEVVVEDAREAELKNKIYLENLTIIFEDEMGENEESSSLRMHVLEALEPHPNLPRMFIQGYKGCKLLAGWMVSPFNQVREVCFSSCDRLVSLPPFGRLPCLEVLRFYGMEGLQFVGRELLGIEGPSSVELPTNTNSNSNTVVFQNLKKLTFGGCPNWKEWDDITTEEEEESAAVSILPCFTRLEIRDCNALTALPRRLLRKASSLKELNIRHSTKLQHYMDEDSSDRKYITQNNSHLIVSDCLE